MKILIACSSGGHLAHAFALQSWWSQHERLWVTSPTDDARAKLVGERVIEAHHPTTRNVPNLLRNTVLARRVLKEYRPDIVFSTGAAIAVPFLLQARSVGARTVYLEAVDRIEKASLTGRMVYPFADEFLVQWQPLAESLPESRNVGVIL